MRTEGITHSTLKGRHIRVILSHVKRNLHGNIWQLQETRREHQETDFELVDFWLQRKGKRREWKLEREEGVASDVKERNKVTIRIK